MITFLKFFSNYEFLKSYLSTLLLLNAVIFSPLISAKTGDTEQPMNISSGTQALDITNNIVTFTDNVVITQGTININADKVTVLRPNGDQTKTIVEAFGAPLTFSQEQDDGKLIEGHSNKMRYELENELITLTGNAFLSQMDSQVSGEQIVYSVKEQQMQAKSGQNQRVTTILVPNQLQEKK